MSRENYIHPLTKHLRETRGMITRGWAEFNGFNPNIAANVIYTGYYHAEIVKKLREEGLYGFLFEDVRAKIEESEAAKEAKGVSTNGNT